MDIKSATAAQVIHEHDDSPLVYQLKKNARPRPSAGCRGQYLLPNNRFRPRESQVIMSRTRSFLESAINYQHDDSPLVKKMEKKIPIPSAGCRQLQAGGGDGHGRRL